MIGRFAPFLISAILFASGCKDPVAFEEALTDQQLGGKTIPAASLSNGRQMYVRQCYACHGLEGDGRGPSSPGLRTAPRARGTAFGRGRTGPRRIRHGTPPSGG